MPVEVNEDRSGGVCERGRESMSRLSVRVEACVRVEPLCCWSMASSGLSGLAAAAFSG